MFKHKLFINKNPKSLIITILVVAALTVTGLILLSNLGEKENLNSTMETNMKDTSNVENVKQGLQLYLVSENSSKKADDSANLDTLDLEAQPLLSGSDILSYNWEMHCLKMKNDGKISKRLLQHRFVVTADGEKIYSGAFWSAVYSMIPPKVSIYLDELNETDSTLILPLASWRPGVTLSEESKKILEDPRIQKVLERDGKLYKAYTPKNFECPDYIDVAQKGSQYNYGGFDWEKKDALLKLLDARFTANLDFVKSELKEEDNASMNQNDTVIILVYNEPRKLKFNISGTERFITARDLLMPMTGKYSDLLLFRGDNGYTSSPVGGFDKFAEKDINLIENELPVQKQTAMIEPTGINLVFSKGGTFQPITVLTYELNAAEADKVNKAAIGKVLKGRPAGNPKTMSLTLRFGKNDDRWFHVLDDRETLFSNGKYYSNPALAKLILNIAEEKCEFTMFHPEALKGIVSAKYSFRTHTRTIERIIEDKAILAKIEKSLQASRVDMGGGCPFSDGVLTLTLSSGKTFELSMASDDCPLMFLNGSYIKYTDELHKLLLDSFDNFPYVRE